MDQENLKKPLFDFVSLYDWILSFNKATTPSILSKKFLRINQLCNLFNNPQNDLKILHVAGTKGKGSVARMLSALLSKEGNLVGLYQSPHIDDVRERITINYSFIEDDLWLKHCNLIKNVLEKHAIIPTVFELLTLISFCMFKDLNCDYVILETGIGGLYDATNIVKPLASIITTIDKDHMNLLGHTIEEIAIQKAGIIKHNTPVFLFKQSYEVVLPLIKDLALDKNAPFVYFDAMIKSYDFYIKDDNLWVKSHMQNNYLEYSFPLKHKIQAENSLFCLGLLKELHLLSKPLDFYTSCFQTLSFKGRFESIGTVILDGAHTPLSLKSVVEAFTELYGNQEILIFNCAKDKIIKDAIPYLKENFNTILICSIGDFKTGSEDYIVKKYNNLVSFLTKEEALNYIIQHDKKVLITGSFYLLGEFRNALLEQYQI